MVCSSFPKDAKFQEILTYIMPLKLASQLRCVIKGSNVFSIYEWPILHEEVIDLR